ncbi:glycosyltransferase [Kineococcus indalonis]|uniref:glycosyltransferase n=1 Tax=Kineococcus indalonis TaxID=2696566 RepID=UPI0014130713|nr:glycosyltransferase [Kineococcus indalonis]NAZ86419.1 glycosyltransferase [Kineococcus indalonis]
MDITPALRAPAVTAPRAPLARRLSRVLTQQAVSAVRRPQGLHRMSPPNTRRRYRCLTVVDVDLDAGTAVPRPTITPAQGRPEGVHALVWFHGQPIGDLTLPGAPDAVLPGLPARAAHRFEQEVLEHLLRDALQTPGGVQRALAEGLRAVAHPERTPDTSGTTVAVCTRDRPEDLRHCLRAIGELSSPVAEVLVVDNASRDERTRQVAEEFGARYVREPRAGLDWARNRALLEARGSIVAFADDDVLVHPRWAENLARAFEDEPDAVLVTGLVAPAEFATPAQVMFEAIGGFGRGYARRWFSVAVDAGEVAARAYPGTGDAGTGANTAVRRERALALGGFDPALDVGTATGGGGDLEMYFRVLAAGELVLYEPGAVIYHRHRATMEQLRRQLRGNGTGSYSIYAGAGANYGTVQALDMALFSTAWFLRYHGRAQVRSLVWPRMYPPELVRADSRGVLDAVFGRYYRRAQEQAAEQAALHPGEPSAPPLVHRPAQRRRRRTADPVVDVDVLRDGPAAVDLSASRRGGRRLRVRVLRDGQPQSTFTVHARGARVTRARLVQELARHLGPALLVPGTSWDDLRSARTGGAQPLTDALGAAVARPAARLDPSVGVSVLMATRDRPGPLRRSLEALLSAATRPLQVVLVDNSADPATTREVVAGLPGVQVVHEPWPGLSPARNAGIPSLTGEVVVLVDDDVVITPGWMEEVLAPFADPSVGLVAGNVLPANVDLLDPQVFEDYGGLGRGPHRRTYDQQWLWGSKAPAPTWQIGATANAAVRRDVLAGLGPFDEVLGPGRPSGIGEDTEYFYRVLRAGWNVVYQPTAVVLHHHRDDRASLLRQMGAYSSGHVAYQLQIAARHGDVRGWRRVVRTLPGHFARQAVAVARGDDDYPGDVLATEVRGAVRGPSAWWRSRLALREADRPVPE